ncbi:MAG: 5-oxoprolinase subunit PxpB [Fulvivirga sp.]|nr:5-oxoprolinase subunit PxpB [Fulvivirga sp.]
MKCIPFGHEALLINFEQEINPKINHEVHELASKLKENKAITFLIPAYCSLTVGYDRQETSFEKLKKEIEKLSPDKQNHVPNKKLKIPVCYDPEFALDMEEVSHQTGLSSKEIITAHTACDFTVYMIGFMPGFPYLGKLPDALHCKRKKVPRKEVPALAVGLAGFQTGIYPASSPGGWQIIGRTPVSLISGATHAHFLLQPGNQVRFYAIDADQFDATKTAFEQGELKIEDTHD